jgi:uncharacterized protein (TIRG00374 family)
MADSAAPTAPTPAAAAKPGGTKVSRRKQIIGTIVTLAVLAFVFFYVFPQFASYQDAWTAIQGMTPAWIVALGIAAVVNIFVYVWPFLVAIPGLRFWPGFEVRQTSFMLSNAIPAVGGAIGLGVQYSMLESFGIASAAAAAGIAINTVWNMIATLGLPVLSVLLLLATGEASQNYIWAAVIGVAAIAVGAVVLTLILRSDEMARKVGRLGDRVAGWALRVIHKPRELNIGEALVGFRLSTVDVIRARWIWLTLSNFAMQFSSFMILFVALRGVQVGESTKTTFIQALAAFALGRLASFIPVTPGGLGTVDAAITGILTGFGANSSDALAADLVWRAATYVPQVIIGIVTFLVWRGQHERQLRREARATEAAPAG